MDTSPVPPQKKGIGALGWVGIGCGALIVIIIVVIFGVAILAGPKLKQFAEDAQKNPTKMAANVTLVTGQFEMVKEDDANKRYTVRQKSNGQLTTFYWDSREGKPKSVQGDFSAIPADANSPAAPATPVPQ